MTIEYRVSSARDNPKVTIDQYNDFFAEFFMSEGSKDLRFGKEFCKSFNITDAALFYEEDLVECLQYITKQYLIQEEYREDT